MGLWALSLGLGVLAFCGIATVMVATFWLTLAYPLFVFMVVVAGPIVGILSVLFHDWLARRS